MSHPLLFHSSYTLATILFLLLSNCGAEDKFNGFSAGNVEFDDSGIPSRIEFIKDLGWRWVNYHGDTLDIMDQEPLTLMGRDEWSLYFCSDTSKIVTHVIVNMFDEIVEMHYHTCLEVFRVEDVAPGILHGWTLGNVVFGCHQLVMHNYPDWEFVDPQTNEKRKVLERHRDEWTAYLDDGEDIAVRVDYHRKVVNVRDRRNGGREEEFKISGADFSTQAFDYFEPNTVPSHLQQCPIRP